MNKYKLKTRLLLVSDVIRATVELSDSPELRSIQNLHLIMTAFHRFRYSLTNSNFLAFHSRKNKIAVLHMN